MSPALAGGFLTTAPPGKPRKYFPVLKRKEILALYNINPEGIMLNERSQIRNKRHSV